MKRNGVLSSSAESLSPQPSSQGYKVKPEKASGNNLTSSASNNCCTTSQSSTVQRTKTDVTPLSATVRLSTVRPGVTSSAVASSLSVKCNCAPSTVESPASMPLKRVPAIAGVRSGERQSAITAPTPIPTSISRLKPTTKTTTIPAASDPNVPKRTPAITEVRSAQRPLAVTSPTSGPASVPKRTPAVAGVRSATPAPKPSVNRLTPATCSSTTSANTAESNVEFATTVPESRVLAATSPKHKPAIAGVHPSVACTSVRPAVSTVMTSVSPVSPRTAAVVRTKMRAGSQPVCDNAAVVSTSRLVVSAGDATTLAAKSKQLLATGSPTTVAPSAAALLSRRSGSLPVLQVPSITPPLQPLRLSSASFSSSIANTAPAKSIVKPTVPEGKKSLMSHLGVNMSRLQAQQSTPKTAPKVSTGSLFAGYGRTSLLDNRIPLLSLSNTPKSASLLGSGVLYNNRLSSALQTGLTVARSAPQLGKRSLPLTLVEADNFDAKRVRVAFSNCSSNAGPKIALTTFKGATVSPALSVDIDTLSSAPSTPAVTGHSQSSVHSQSSLDSDMLGSDDLSSVLDEVSCWLKDAVVPESRGQTLDHLPALSCGGDGWENWLMDDLL